MGWRCGMFEGALTPWTCCKAALCPIVPGDTEEGNGRGPLCEPTELAIVATDSSGAGAEYAKSMPVADGREARGDRLWLDAPSLSCRGGMPLEASCMGTCKEDVWL